MNKWNTTYQPARLDPCYTTSDTAAKRGHGNGVHTRTYLGIKKIESRNFYIGDIPYPLEETRFQSHQWPSSTFPSASSRKHGQGITTTCWITTNLNMRVKDETRTTSTSRIKTDPYSFSNHRMARDTPSKGWGRWYRNIVLDLRTTGTQSSQNGSSKLMKTRCYFKRGTADC